MTRFISTIAFGTALLASALSFAAPAYAGGCDLKVKQKRTAAECAAKHPGLIPGTVYGCVWKETQEQAYCHTPVVPKVTYRHVDTTSYGLQCPGGATPYPDPTDGKMICPTVQSSYRATTTTNYVAQPQREVVVTAEKPSRSWLDVQTQPVRGARIQTTGTWGSVQRYGATMDTVGDVAQSVATVWGAKEIGDGLANSGSTTTITNNATGATGGNAGRGQSHGSGDTDGNLGTGTSGGRGGQSHGAGATGFGQGISGSNTGSVIGTGSTYTGTGSIATPSTGTSGGGRGQSSGSGGM